MNIRKVSKNADIKNILKNIGVHNDCIEILQNKSENIFILVENVNSAIANILKQDLLSLGSDAAVHNDVICHGIDVSSVLIICRYDHLKKLIDKISKQPFSKLKELSEKLTFFLNNTENNEIIIGGKKLTCSDGPFIMGILNATPDSFSDGGKFNTVEKALIQCEQMINNGADIIDIGGESTRPGAARVEKEEEINRVVPLIKELRKRFDILISIDTSKAAVAKTALDNGADMINDISGVSDPEMLEVIRSFKSSVCIMHMQGNPETMQKDPVYKKDVVHEIYDILNSRINTVIEAGLKRSQCIIDPGIGFGKTLEHNLKILKRIDEFKSLHCPLLLGTSRKSFIGSITGNSVDERLAGSLATISASFPYIDIYRVHDVKETKDTLNILKAIKNTI